jgi:hypothetical protein
VPPSERALSVVPAFVGLPGSVRLRSEVPAPVAHAVVDVETTGTSVEADEIVSLAVVRPGSRVGWRSTR